MKRIVTLLALAGALALSASGGPAAASDAASAGEAKAVAAACKSVRYGGDRYVMYREGRVRCRFARRWVRRLHRSEGDNSPRGWTCESGSDFRTGGGCTKGRRAFGWHPGD